MQFRKIADHNQQVITGVYGLWLFIPGGTQTKDTSVNCLFLAFATAFWNSEYLCRLVNNQRHFKTIKN
jgi:hypothetical protein